MDSSGDCKTHIGQEDDFLKKSLKKKYFFKQKLAGRFYKEKLNNFRFSPNKVMKESFCLTEIFCHQITIFINL